MCLQQFFVLEEDNAYLNVNSLIQQLNSTVDMNILNIEHIPVFML